MNENLDIFIFTHRDFEIKPTNPCYKIVSIEDFKADSNLEHIVCDKSKDEILNKEHGYSELARLHYIWKNCELKDYIGTAHYRRYFEFFDNVPNMDEIFKEHDAILPGNFDLGWPSVYENYSCCHSNDDIIKVLNIICKKYNTFFKSAIDVMVGKQLYPCNLFILKKETFNEWCNFVFGVLNEYDNIMGLKTDRDILDEVIKRGYPPENGRQNGSNDYQSRIEAFLSERLSTIFFHEKIKNPLFVNMILTEWQYEYEKSYYNYVDLRNK